MNRKALLSALIPLTLLLAACDILPDPVDPNQQEVEVSDEESDNQEQEEGASTIEVQMDSGYYRPVISEDGSYQPSENRGITRELNSSINIRTFEDDLMRHSQRYFPTDTHFFQEGQFLSSELVSNWLRREDPEEDDDQGLNPESTGSTDPNERNPNYLSSILEHNFYVQTDDGLSLSGVSIGLALNQIDYYSEGDESLEQDIPLEEVIEAGQAMGDEIISRVREIEGLEEVPIMIALYVQSSSDDLAPGTYVAEALSEDGEASISSWNAINEERLVFPLEGMQSAEGNSFANFQSEVTNFFPNISGVTGIAHYIEEQLVDLEIDIMTQFYGKGEMIAFTQTLNETATNFLPEAVPVRIKVETLNGIESFLYKEDGQEGYEVFIFN